MTRNFRQIARTVLSQLENKGVALAWETEMAVSDFHDAAPLFSKLFPEMPTEKDLLQWMWAVRAIPSAGVYAYVTPDKHVHVGLAYPVPLGD